MIDHPGVYNLPAEEYHADPVVGGSLSSTGARKLLPPSCPALFQQWRTNPPEHRDEWDFGHVAHSLVLGAGPQIVVVDADDWRGRKAQNQRKDAYAAGMVPVLRDDYAHAQAMAKVIREHPDAGSLFHPSTGEPEQTVVWFDEEFGVWRRALVDWLRTKTDGLIIIPDYKTTACAEPRYLAKALYNFGYHMQGAWYLDGVSSVNRVDPSELAFVLVFQEKTPPYLVTVAQVSPYALSLGRKLNRRALGTYAWCTRTGYWPGYGIGHQNGVVSLDLPGWAERDTEWELEQPSYETWEVPDGR